MFLTGVLVNIGSVRERVVGVGATNPFAGSPGSPGSPGSAGSQ
jgi:hypothetical protein